MAINKKAQFKDDDVELAEIAKCLSHPARIAILKHLVHHKNLTCKELVMELPLSQATVSQHLKELLKSNLICYTAEGNNSLYCIEWNQLERVFSLFGRFNLKTMPHRPKRNCC